MPGERLSSGRVAALALAVVVAAIALGVAARWATGVERLTLIGTVAEPAAQLRPWVIALGAPWLAVAWLLGAFGRRPLAGAVAGAAALAGGTAAWYAFTVYSEGRSVLEHAVRVCLAWGSAALVAGALFGAAGALWRSGTSAFARALGVAVLAASLIGEAVLLLTEWDGRAARAVLAVELLCGLLLPFVLLLRRPLALLLCIGLTAVLAVAAAGLEDAVRDALRHVGWSGL